MSKPTLAILFAVAGLCMPSLLAAQTDSGPSLGDLARSLRRQKLEAASTAPVAPAKPIISNENLSDAVDEAAKRKRTGALSYSFDSTGKTFQVSSPDVTCSLSFNANMTSLLSDPFASRELPAGALGKIEGPAVINGDTLQLTVYNGTGWDLREITVGLTVIRHAEPRMAQAFVPRLLPVSGTSIDGTDSEIVPQPPLVSDERHSDVTVLYHLKGVAAPSATTVFHQPLDMPLAPGDDWHWAIVEARGVPPATAVPPAGVTAVPSLGAANVPMANSPVAK